MAAGEGSSMVLWRNGEEVGFEESPRAFWKEGERGERGFDMMGVCEELKLFVYGKVDCCWGCRVNKR